MTVTVPLAKPTAIWERSSRAVKADICDVKLLDQDLSPSRNTLALWPTDRELLLPIVHVERAEARREAGLLDDLVEGPDLEDGFATEVLGDRDQQAGPLNLSHVGDGGVVGLEAPDDLPAGADDADISIVAAEEEAIGPGADLGDLVAFEQEARLVVGQADLADLEEVEFPPLSRLALVGVDRREEFGAHIPRLPSLHLRVGLDGGCVNGRWRALSVFGG